MKNLDLLIPKTPETKDTFTWATVDSVEPLRIRFDGESSPMTGSPESLVNGLEPGDRVWTQMHGRRVFVVGRAGGPRGTTRSNLVGDIRFPAYIAHRGARSLFPESSMESQRTMAQRGYPTEIDLRLLADGKTLVACHDVTVDRTMLDIGTGDVSTKTVEEWRNARVAPAVQGGATGTPIFFEDWLDELGHRHLLVPELKTKGATQPVIEAILERGLERSVIVQSFDFADASEMAAAGLTVAYLFDGWWPDESAQQIADAGIWGIGCSTAADAGTLQSMKDAGLPRIMYTINDPEVAAEKIASGLEGLFSDDPELISGRIPRRPSDTFHTGFLSPGCRQHNYNLAGFSTPFHLNGAALTIPRQASASDGRPWVVVPELSPRTNNFRITFDMEYGANGASGYQGGSPGLILWKNTVDPYALWQDTAVAGQEGFTLAGRRNGQLEAWKYVNGASASSIGQSPSQSGADQFAQQDRPGRAQILFEVKDGTIRMDALSHGYQWSAADTFAPSGLTFALRGDREFDVTFSNIRVVDL